MTTVVAAVIERANLILIAQRRPDGPHGLKWEFPGGKVDAGETTGAALQRELAEELAIQATIGPEMLRYAFAYPQKPPILLVFYRVTEFSGEPSNQVFQRLAWVGKQDLGRYDFLEGDVEFLKTLMTQ